jgi:hypothetical protein
MAKKAEMFPSRFLRVEELEGKPAVLKIEDAVSENLKDFNTGKVKAKTVLSFEGTDKVLVLSAKANWDGVVKATGCDDSDDWPGHSIEVYPATTEVGGETRDCIRVRPVTKKKVAPPPDDPDDPGFGDDDIHDEAAE